VSKSKEPVRKAGSFAPVSDPLQFLPATLDDVQKEYEKNYSQFLSYARLLTPSLMSAEDLVQQAFSNTVKQIKKNNKINPETMTGYIKSTIRNLSIKSHRKESVQPKLRIVEESEKSPDVLHLMSADKKLLLESIAELVPSQRTITIMFYFDGMKVEEIAYELGLSASAVKTNLARARKHLFNTVAPHVDFVEENNE